MGKFVTLNWVQARRAGMQSALNDADARVEKVSPAMREVVAAPGLTPEFRAEKLEALRKPVVDAVTALVNDADAQLKLVVAQKPYWQSVEFQLAQQTFSADPIADAQIRLQKSDEFSRMSAGLLQLVANAALLEEDWPTLWVAFNVSRQHHGEPGWAGIDLSTVQLPEMQHALDSIAACENLNVLLHQAWVRAQGQLETPTSKLTSARAAAALGQSRRGVNPNNVVHA